MVSGEEGYRVFQTDVFIYCSEKGEKKQKSLY